MPRDRSADVLNDILSFIDRIDSWTPTDPTRTEVDEKTLYAVLHALQYIGEAVARLPADIPSGCMRLDRRTRAAVDVDRHAGNEGRGVRA